MYVYQCEICGCTMDPGEGSGGVCEECIFEKDQKIVRRRELEQMCRSLNYKQMEMEEFING